MDTRRDTSLKIGSELLRNSTVNEKKIRQILLSFPHYWFEIRQCKSIFEIYEWLYYKFPQLFPLRVLPSVVNIELTNNCNFQCPHCPRDTLNEDRGLGFMAMETFEKIVREIAGRVPVVKFIGLGEPSLHPDLPKIMRLLKDNGIKVLLYTNGTLFERYAPEEIVSWKVDQLVVSIDGTDDRSFARLRVGGNLQDLKTKLAEFRTFRAATGSLTPRVEVRHVIMPHETPEMLRSFTAFWRKSFADTVKYNSLGIPYDKPRPSVRQRPPCRDIRREMHVRFDGKVPLCGYEGHREWIGGLAESGVGEVWRAPRLTAVRQQHQKRDLSELPLCKTCQFR